MTVADGAAWDRGWRGVAVREWPLRGSSKLDEATRETGARLERTRGACGAGGRCGVARFLGRRADRHYARR